MRETGGRGDRAGRSDRAESTAQPGRRPVPEKNPYTERMNTKPSFLRTFLRSPRATLDLPICRLGLATRGNCGLTPDDVRHAVESGVNFLNWCGAPDGLSEFIAGLGSRRS